MFEDSDFWGSMRDAFKGFYNSNGFQSFAQEAVPSIGGGLAAGGLNALFSGLAGAKGLDTRTDQGRAAEDLRLGGARGASKEYNLALQGKLDPYQEEQIKKRVRAADAAGSGAGGSLETGGHTGREVNAIQEQVQRNKATAGGNLASFSGGYQARSPYNFNQQNPWAMALTGPIGRGFERGISSAWKAKKQDNYDDAFDPNGKNNAGLNWNFSEGG